MCRWIWLNPRRDGIQLRRAEKTRREEKGGISTKIWRINKISEANRGQNYHHVCPRHNFGSTLILQTYTLSNLMDQTGMSLPSKLYLLVYSNFYAMAKKYSPLDRKSPLLSFRFSFKMCFISVKNIKLTLRIANPNRDFSLTFNTDQ